MTNKTPLVLYLPHFKIEFDAEMSATLKSLGVTKSFTDGTGFQRMSPGSDSTVIQYVYHKTVAEVDEEGTVAAAATAVTVAYRCMPQSFIVDRPFLFGIQHVETGAFVFLGKIIDPQELQR